MIAGKESDPILFMSNHPMMTREFYGIHQLHKDRPNLVVACDAAVGSVLNRFGIDFIGMDSPGKAHWTKNKAYQARTYLLQMFGRITHAYENAAKGPEIIDLMVETLRDGKDLFICPAGVADPEVKWHSGIGSVAMRIGEEPVHAGFVYIPNSYFQGNIVEIGPTIGSLLPQDGELHPRQVALQLQNEYNRRISAALAESSF